MITDKERLVAEAFENLAARLADAGAHENTYYRYRGLAEHVYEHGLVTRRNARLCLKLESLGSRWPCALCERSTDKDIPYAIFLDGPDSREHVCDTCAREIQPEIVKARDLLNSPDYERVSTPAAPQDWGSPLTADDLRGF